MICCLDIPHFCKTLVTAIPVGFLSFLWLCYTIKKLCFGEDLGPWGAGTGGEEAVVSFPSSCCCSQESPVSCRDVLCLQSIQELLDRSGALLPSPGSRLHSPLDTEFLSRISSAILSLSSLQILTELEHSGIGRIKEQSARMLGHLVSNAPRLIRPYMEPILKVTHSRQRDWRFLQVVLCQLVWGNGSVSVLTGTLSEVDMSFVPGSGTRATSSTLRWLKNTKNLINCSRGLSL